jgi:DNA-binding beta-propeller fold protein YncE
MRTGSTLRVIGLLCALLAMLLTATPSAQASRPLLSEKAVKPTGEGSQIPEEEIEGACGVALFGGAIYVSDYYHFAVDVFGSATQVLAQPPAADRDGPCGLAFDPSGNLYVNYWHHSVAKFAPPYSYGAIQTFDSEESTGVAVDQASGTVYVNDRTYVAVYQPSGAPLLDGEGDPLQIGLGNLEDAFGVATFAGRVYVPDAADDTVKVFEPATSTSVPLATIAGFNSLTDAALAVDPTNGHLLVVDNAQPLFEHPKSEIREFGSAADGYPDLGVLPGAPVFGGPSGIAVSATGTVLVTDGNSELANVFAFGPYVAGSPAALAPAAPAAPAAATSAVAPAGAALVQAPSSTAAPPRAHPRRKQHRRPARHRHRHRKMGGRR